ncbi:tRNA threonylcarbamoyladenosine modification protein TsaD [Caldimicrobium thiodismutans]|jgi:N6-L-threonylcarbamoyladenine synthase|uniref:tRNA N6-adenosine threonylcarbamoyltransferase n=1 Tax=Caldimicrobium thiodismutans TaxID=1653476 RepID=A0A0U5BYC1_9BACT|nr:tRNA (adenosine(37)-N6)-threonylcarbamoyltransferase complex transferase subunit TsaD [Caldimicrobium thiodismutans]BAU23781.1 tRNA threonylcarbamoyladenosine modification protein TsaD [Caldimicrobium thiodismutans]
MLLAIETSCDETGVALFSEEGTLVEDFLYSQVALHSPYGGIVPEIASRKQLEVLHPLVKRALEERALKPYDLKGVAVTFGPGLLGSLLVGVTYAKTLSLALKIPLIAVDHLSAHLFSIFLEREVSFPYLGLLVSGGHTALFVVQDFDSLKLIGHTRDDAAGEAFDKIAKLLGLPYPGGPVISELAEKGDPEKYPLPRPMLEEENFDFSFSGLKTAVFQLLKREGNLRNEDLCASFQKALCEVLVEKTLRAARVLGIKRIVVAGGVSANTYLRGLFQERAQEEEIFFPHPKYCTDNAAMVGFLGWIKFKKKDFASLDAEPYSRALFKKSRP